MKRLLMLPILFHVSILALIPTISCRPWKQDSPPVNQAEGPWRSKATTDGPNWKGKPGPYLAFSGTKAQYGKVHHEVNLYGFGMDPDPQPMFAGKGGFCTLERIIVMKTLSLSLVLIKNYSTRGGTIKITKADWGEGILDFEFGDEYEDNPFQCQLQFEQIDGAAFLRSFRAVAVKKSDLSGKMFTIEYRPAEYSYTLNVPLSMTGMKAGN